MSTPSLLNIPYVIKAGTLYSQIPETGAGDFTVTRATTPTANLSTRINANGFIELVNDNVPRLDYPLGGAVNGCPALLVEPSATNGIRNNSMVGAVSGGALPTNWSFGTGAGVSGTVTAVGTENGIPYIDLRINGTATATSGQVNIETANQIAALNGQVWTISSYLKTIASPLPPISSALLITERTSGGASSAQNTLAISLTSSLARYPYSVTLNGGPTTAFAQPRLSFSFTIGQPYDFTIRIGYPQMELGSVATSVIHTTTQAITRGADVINKTGVSSLIGQTEGTIYAEFTNTLVASYVEGYMYRVFADANNEIWARKEGGANTYSFRWRANSQNTTFLNVAVPNGVNKIAFGYKSGDTALFLNGSQVATTNTDVRAFSVNPTTIALGSTSSGQFFNDRIRATALYPTRLTNSELQALTTP
jgi:hypothetical protein